MATIPSVWNELQAWYLEECDGDWEHAFGIRIETSDNPGWIVRIDLHATNWADLKVEKELSSCDELNWMLTEISNSIFIGSCGPLMLDRLLQRFFELIGLVSLGADRST